MPQLAESLGYGRTSPEAKNLSNFSKAVAKQFNLGPWAGRSALSEFLTHPTISPVIPKQLAAALSEAPQIKGNPEREDAIKKAGANAARAGELGEAPRAVVGKFFYDVGQALQLPPVSGQPDGDVRDNHSRPTAPDAAKGAQPPSPGAGGGLEPPSKAPGASKWWPW